MTDSTIEAFEAVAQVLLYCWLFGFALLLFWFGTHRLAAGFVHRLHGGMFGLSRHEMDVIFYCGMGLLKLGVILLFFFPWLAIRLLL